MTTTHLEKDNLDKNPIIEFLKWFEIARKDDLITADNVILATSYRNRPSARTLLLKGVDQKGFRFYTNYGSRKSHELVKNPFAAMVFNWKNIEVQVRIEGKVAKLSKAESAAYFHSRPRESQLASMASPQSEKVPSRQFLMDRMMLLEKQYAGKEIPLPKFWGGFILKPDYFEFMFAREFRLHDRFSYQKKGSKWLIERLGP